MSPTLLDAKDWARVESGGAELGDPRREARLVKVAAGLAQNPRGTLHGALPTCAELMGGYRLLERPEVSLEQVTAPHRQRTRHACDQPRALADGEGSVFEAVAQAAPLGAYTLHLRARAGQPARDATLEVRAARVTLRGPWRPGGALPPLATQTQRGAAHMFRLLGQVLLQNP